MDRHLWNATLTEAVSPSYPCPACKSGVLSLAQDSLVCHETRSSISEHGSDGWEPEWITYAFSAWLRCGNSKCGQMCTVSGVGGVEPSFPEEDGQGWEDYFAPRCLWPMPDIIRLPAKCPLEVASSLRASFALVWSDQKAAANHLRSALEQLMDKLGIQTKRKTRKGQFEDLSLHARIQIYSQKDHTIGTSLMALKWLGNSGSHGAEVTRDDLLNAYEIVEHAIAEIIDERSKRVAALAKAITKRHRLPRRR